MAAGRVVVAGSVLAVVIVPAALRPDVPPVGTGKTHLASALAVSGITAHNKRVRFFSTVDLMNLLEREKYDGKAGRIAQTLTQTSVSDWMLATRLRQWRTCMEPRFSKLAS